MRKIQRKRKQIASLLCLALLCGLFFEPMANVAKAGETEISVEVSSDATLTPSSEDTQSPSSEDTQSPSPEAGLTPSPEAATSATPGATVVPTPTVKPYMTPNPNATIRLGDNDIDVKMTVGDKGTFDLDWTNTLEFPAEKLAKLTRIEYDSMNESVLAVTENGQYEAKSMGRVTLSVHGYGDAGWFYSSYTVLVFPDMNAVTIAKDSATIYLVENSYYYDSEVEINIQGLAADTNNSYFDEEDILSVVSSNSDMSVDVSLSDNKLILSCYTTGKTQLTITIYGKVFNLELKVVSIKMSTNSVLLAKKQTKKLKVKGYSGKVTWKSSRKKVASVSSKGKVKAKKEGNTIITVKIEDCKIGCVVSVTNARKKKAIRRAQRIASTSKYSQPRRMQKGYYDCSSLTWRSYSKYGYSLGGSGYAPVAASQAQWLAQKKKLVKGGLSQKNIQNLKLNAGDLFFETGAKNGRYKGIYHVEMISGYAFYGFDGNGDPIVAVKWANRPDGYYGYAGGIVGRP